MAIFVTSDEHYDHGKIIELSGRPFRHLTEMREQMILRHNRVVQPDDVVWHLGDFSFAKVPESMAILARLNGEHHLVLGNHDRSTTSMLSVGFKTAQYSSRFEINGFRVVMRHLPSAHAVCDDRKFELKFYGSLDDADLVLCGHVHEKWRRQGNVINVGVDVNDFTPVRIEDLIAEVKND